MNNPYAIVIHNNKYKNCTVHTRNSKESAIACALDAINDVEYNDTLQTKEIAKALKENMFWSDGEEFYSIYISKIWSQED